MCKALTCGEFIPAVLDGIYDLLDGIVFLYPERDWNGDVKQNEVSQPVRKWKQENDYALKIDCIHTEEINQEKQYAFAIDYICKTMKPDWIFIFDTDEVWEKVELKKLFNHAESCVKQNALYCNMYTYVKSPLYRVEPIEPCKPCVMVRAIPGLFKGIRGNRTRPGFFAKDVYFHHFSYVRNNVDKVLEKIRLSTLADGFGCVDLKKWIVEKWNLLPSAKNLHTTQTAECFWDHVRVVNEKEIPEAVRKLEIFQRRVN